MHLVLATQKEENHYPKDYLGRIDSYFPFFTTKQYNPCPLMY